MAFRNTRCMPSPRKRIPAFLAEHLDANTAQTLASRAYHAESSVCVGTARRVRFRSYGRGLSSLEGKTNKQGIRFVLQPAKARQPGLARLGGRSDQRARVSWQDPV